MLNLEEMLDDGKRIFVRNRTGRFQDRQGVYVLQVRDRNGDGKPLYIPATKFPYCLSGKAPTESLKQCQDLYDALERGLLELVDPDEAAREIAADDGIANKANEQSLSKFQPTRRAPKADIKEANAEPDPNEMMMDAVEVVTPKNELKLSIVIQQICADLKDDPELWEEKYAELKGMEDTQYTEDDLGYMMTQIQHPRIQDWVKGELAKRQGSTIKKGRRRHQK